MPYEPAQFKKAKDYGFLLLKFRPRSISEFRQRLSMRGFSEEIILQLVSDFTKRGLLDDVRFASVWVDERINTKPMGAFRLKAELQGKGLSKGQIDSALSDIDSNAEYDAAMLAAKKRIKSLIGLDKPTFKRRLFAFLERRGFSYDVITRVIKDEGGCNS